MEETEMGVHFSITSCEEVEKEIDGKKMVVWEAKTSKEVFATDDALKDWIKSTSEAHSHVTVTKVSEKAGKGRRPRMRFACERSGKYMKCEEA